MPRRRRKNRRRSRRGRFSFLYKVLSILLICGAIVGAMTFLFRVNAIEITGVSHYSEAEILSAAGIKQGDNLYLINKYDVADDIFEKLPFVQAVKINRRLPETLTIAVQECIPVGTVKQEGGTWLISSRGKILASVSEEEALIYPVIDGVTLLSPAVGTTIALGEEHRATEEKMLELFLKLEEKGMVSELRGVHMGEESMITMDYADRFTVKFAWDADFDYKLQNLQVVISKLEVNETGIIDLTRDGVANFIPY